MEEKKNNSRIRLAISQGDINGIGYEVILKTFSDSRMFDICTPILYGSTKVASYHKKLLALHQDLANFYIVYLILFKMHYFPYRSHWR